jgi:hypothetical protein
MRPLLVAAGALAALLGASALLEVRDADADGDYREDALGYLYAGGVTVGGLALVVAGVVL